MEEHVEKDNKVDEKRLNKVTKMFNESSKSFVKILGIGKTSKQESRAMYNVHMSTNLSVPVLSGLHKVHKSGRKMRPLVNGNTGPLSNFSDILSDVLEAYVEELRNKVDNQVCKSTENLLPFSD